MMTIVEDEKNRLFLACVHNETKDKQIDSV